MTCAHQADGDARAAVSRRDKELLGYCTRAPGQKKRVFVLSNLDQIQTNAPSWRRCSTPHNPQRNDRYSPQGSPIVCQASQRRMHVAVRRAAPGTRASPVTHRGGAVSGHLPRTCADIVCESLGHMLSIPHCGPEQRHQAMHPTTKGFLTVTYRCACTSHVAQQITRALTAGSPYHETPTSTPQRGNENVVGSEGLT